MSYLLLEKNWFNLLDDEYFTITYVTYTIPSSPEGHQLTTQDEQNLLIIAINGEVPITAQGDIGELNLHQNKRGKYKVKTSLFRRTSYQRTDIEDICFVFDQFGPVNSHLGVYLPEKPSTAKNIGEGLKGPQRKFCKEDLFVQYDKNKNGSLLSAPVPIKYLPELTKVLCLLIAPSIK